MIDHTTALSRLNTVFRDVFNDDSLDVRDETTAQDVDEWDSLAHITLIVNVEKEFKIKFSAAEVGSFANVGQMLQLIMQRTST